MTLTILNFSLDTSSARNPNRAPGDVLWREREGNGEPPVDGMIKLDVDQRNTSSRVTKVAIIGTVTFISQGAIRVTANPVGSQR